MSAIDMNDLERRMDGALQSLKSEYQGLRTGRASASLLEPIQVDAYGAMTPITQVASITVPEPRMIVVNVWDRSVAQAVEKAIRESGLGLNPASEGATLRVPIPPLNEERRASLAKLAGKYAEDCRVAIRNVRRSGMDALKKAEKDGDIGKDEHKGLADKVQSKTDTFIAKVDEILKSKEEEIMQV